MSNINDKDNYAAGRRDEQLRQQNNSSVGVLIGIVLVLGIGGIAAALFFFNRSETPVAPVIAPSATPESPPVIEKHETIIREKSTEVVPVPVSPAAQPNINITVPSTQPSANSTQPSSEASSPSPLPSSTTSPAPVSPKP
jgi:flagellar basal body-associated protein FliL